MIQKKSLKDAIQNPEIISVVGGLIPYLVYSLDANKITDANNSVDGVYKLPSTALNMPSGETGLGCFLWTISWDGSTKYQMLWGYKTLKLYIRIRTSGTWRNWNAIGTFPTNQ